MENNLDQKLINLKQRFDPTKIEPAPTKQTGVDNIVKKIMDNSLVVNVVKAGAKGIDDPAFQRRLLRVREIVNQEIRLATALGIGGGTAETAETIQEATAPIVEDIKQEVVPAVENVRQEIAPELQNMRTQVDPNLLRQYTPGSTNLTASNVERERARMGIAGLMS